MDELRPEILAWLGEALSRQAAGNLTGALLLYRRILDRNPDIADAWCNLAVVLHGLGRDEEARPACLRSLELAPSNPAGHITLGNLLLKAGNLQGAQEAFHRALALDPRDPVAHSGLATALSRSDRLPEAIEADRTALALAPSRGDLHLNLGHALMRSGDLTGAEPLFLEALRLEPGLPLARWDLAYLRLLQGRYAEAWPDFGARLEVPDGLDNLRSFAEPAWNGRPFPGRTLLLWSEQGLGDTLQFARYLPLAKALGGTVLLQAYPPVMDLLKGVPGVDAVLADGAELPPFDLQAPLLDLPTLLGSQVPDPPPPAPLAPPAGHSLLPNLQALLPADGARRAGIVWRGNPAHANDARRSLDPALLAPLLELPGYQWMSLQVGAPAPAGAVDLGQGLRDFSDTAAVLRRLDLVVTVDTALVHLAGSMGVPTHLLLPFFPDWRWRMEGRACPWYPSVMIHRQPSPGDWPTVIRALRDELVHAS